MSKEILKHIIDNFLPEDFIDFFRTKNRSFKPHAEQADEYNDNDFKDALSIGQIPFHQTESLIVYSFKATKNLSERSGKKLQYEKGKKILKDTQADAGIFIFYDTNNNFRFSLIYFEYAGTQRKGSSFKRFTYFVSPELTNKTFLQRIGDGDFSSIDTIKEAFSVEKVTREFYSEIANWYFGAVENCRFPEDAERLEKGRNIAIIRLITRIIFIWFMKVRGLVPDELFKEDKIKEILTDISPDESTYYKAILQNLFFATLNTRQEQRKFRTEVRGHKGYNPDYGNHCVYRYLKLFKNLESIEEYFGKIPFLNGGLFECLDYKSKLKEERVYIDGFTDTTKHQSYIPNFLFFSNEKFSTKNKVRGLIDILSSYNFTIDENASDDQEIALDPELLGRVFENLLASYNPETATTARKATGSYYTPREIVDYMVTQSLIQYFKSHLSPEPELNTRLTELFSSQSLNNPFDDSTAKRIIQLIESLRIVDPAVGSGAFPMGILNKLVFILSKLDPVNRLWKQTQIDAIKQSVTDPVVQKRLISQVEQQFEYKHANYGRKLYLIEKCIYGVDIQQIAVEIAKLRFFIALLVDEKVDIEKSNYGIEPLPNLDFKLMQGNSLVSNFMGMNFDLDKESKNNTSDSDVEIKIVNLKNYQNKLSNEFIKLHQPNKYSDTKKAEMEAELIKIANELKRLENLKNERDVQKQSSYNYKDKLTDLTMQFQQKKNEYQNEPDKDKKDALRSKIEDLLMQIFEEKIKQHLPQLKGIEEKYVALSNSSKRAEYIAAEKHKVCKKLGFDLKQAEKDLIAYTEGRKPKDFFLWDIYFAEVFHEKDGFDIVIGNPPYVRIQTMKEATANDAKYYKENYISAQKGNYDIYVVFLENGIQFLNKGGGLAFILPHKFFNAQYGQPIRELLAKGKHVSQIVHFGEHQVFQGATNYTCLLFLNKTGVDRCRFIKVEDLEKWFDAYEGTEGIIAASQITSAEWNFVVGKGSVLFEKLSKMPHKLGDVADVFVGLQTSADDVFIMDLIEETSKSLRLKSKALGSEWVFEKDLLFPIVSGTDVSCYAPLPSRQYILFPYQTNNASAILIDFKTITEKCPKTAAYLKENKKRLEERERGKFKDSEWYRFGRNQNIGIQEQITNQFISKASLWYNMRHERNRWQKVKA